VTKLWDKSILKYHNSLRKKPRKQGMKNAA